MADYTPTIGLEIHAQLRTKTKMFCNSKNDPDETRPNVNVCPICMGHPGTLPTLNKEAIKHVLKVGVAVGGTLADFTEWDRKNYFYPDIPKGYQISQYKYPLVTGGSINGVEITRIHLEEDTARNVHTKNGSLIDFNRAGIPLMELVTEPVIHSAEEAGAFAKELQLLLRYLGVSEANMEKGEMRVEANISVAEGNKRGTKVEIKNLNSFKSVERGIAHEVDRQAVLLKAGKEVIQETRGWDESMQETFSQRRKETSEDYRYFPEPDLPKLKVSEIPEFAEDILRKELPELPWERRERYLKLGVSLENAGALIPSIRGDIFEDVIKGRENQRKFVKLAADFIVSDLPKVIGATRGGIKIQPASIIGITEMRVNNILSSTAATEVFSIAAATNQDNVQKIAEREGLIQKSDEGELKKIAEKVIKENQGAAKEYKAGKEASLKFLIGQGMKESKGAANPQVLGKLFKELLQ